MPALLFGRRWPVADPGVARPFPDQIGYRRRPFWHPDLRAAWMSWHAGLKAAEPRPFWSPELPEVLPFDGEGNARAAAGGWRDVCVFVDPVGHRRIVHRLLAALLLCLLLPAASWAATLQGVPRVVDGDTLEVAGQRVRLFGIDAPEQETCRRASGAEWHCGWAASVELEALIGGRPVRCEGGERDRYGRLVARCWVGQVDLGGALVVRGLALAFRRYSLAYGSAEATARAARAGVWAGPFVEPREWRKGARR